MVPLSWFVERYISDYSDFTLLRIKQNSNKDIHYIKNGKWNTIAILHELSPEM